MEGICEIGNGLYRCQFGDKVIICGKNFLKELDKKMGEYAKRIQLPKEKIDIVGSPQYLVVDEEKLEKWISEDRQKL